MQAPTEDGLNRTDIVVISAEMFRVDSILVVPARCTASVSAVVVVVVIVAAANTVVALFLPSRGRSVADGRESRFVVLLVRLFALEGNEATGSARILAVVANRFRCLRIRLCTLAKSNGGARIGGLG